MNMKLEPVSTGAKNDQAFVLFFLLALAGIYLLYQLGFVADWTFDDWLTLNGLSQVVDYDSAKTYVLGNTTGPTGRPIAMLSFLLNVQDWDQHPEGFRQINTAIHLFNILLVAVAAWQIARLVPSLASHAIGFAVFLALIWGVHPLFASGVLSAVQRMVLLSASFVLLGINGYLYGRAQAFSHPLRGQLIMLVSLAVGLVLATFSKENGALMPAFVGLLELQILSRYRPSNLGYLKPIAQLMLWGTLLVFLLYIVLSWPAIVAGQDGAYRDFSWSQRIWSEFLILWEYVRQIFIPDIMTMGPLQDDTSRIHGLDPYTFTALLAWCGALLYSWLQRKRRPILLFGIGFFLVGHLIESSFIQLELYFEHRNYIPSLGLLAIPAALLYLSKSMLLRLLGWIVVLPLLSFLLYLTTSAWADPLVSSQRWFSAHPTSLRALQMRIRIKTIAEGSEAAARFSAAVSDQMPERINVAALALKLQCETGDSTTGLRLLERVETLSKRPNPLRGALGFLGFIEETLSRRLNNSCTWITFPRMRDILQPLLEDPAIKKHPSDLSRLLVNLGLVNIAMGDVLKGVNQINQGYQMHRSYRLFGLYSRVLRDLGQPQAAEALRKAFLAQLPGGISSMEEHRRRVNEAYNGHVEGIDAEHTPTHGE